MSTLLKSAVAISVAAFVALLVVPTAARAQAELAIAAPPDAVDGATRPAPPKCDEAFLLAWYQRHLELGAADPAPLEPLPAECWPEAREPRVEAKHQMPTQAPRANSAWLR